MLKLENNILVLKIEVGLLKNFKNQYLNYYCTYIVN